MPNDDLIAALERAVAIFSGKGEWQPVSVWDADAALIRAHIETLRNGGSVAVMKAHESDQILPCPRCGCDEIAYGYGGPPWSASVECYADDCRAIMLSYDSEEEAISLWNKGFWTGLLFVDDDGFNVINPVAGFRPRSMIDATA